MDAGAFHEGVYQVPENLRAKAALIAPSLSLAPIARLFQHTRACVEKVAFWAKMLAKLSWQEVGMRVIEGCNLCSSFGGFFVKLNTPQYN